MRRLLSCNPTLPAGRTLHPACCRKRPLPALSSRRPCSRRLASVSVRWMPHSPRLLPAKPSFSPAAATAPSILVPASRISPTMPICIARQREGATAERAGLKKGGVEDGHCMPCRSQTSWLHRIGGGQQQDFAALKAGATLSCVSRPVHRPVPRKAGKARFQAGMDAESMKSHPTKGFTETQPDSNTAGAGQSPTQRCMCAKQA